MATIVQLRDLRESRSRALHIFHVQPFWLDHGELGAARLREFRTEREAMAAARALSVRYHQVRVSVITGYVGTELWDDPVLLAVYEKGDGAAMSTAFRA